MNFDIAHDTQGIFRAILEAISKPGTMVNIRQFVQGIDLVTEDQQSAIGVAMSLLDGETSFAWVGADAAEGAALLARLTNCRIHAVEEAAFVFVKGSDTLLCETLERAHRGTLIDPHLGGTIIVLLARCGEGDTELVLSGPGIEHESHLRLDLGDDWVAVRNECVKEFPLGVDLLFVDDSGNMAAIPRSSRLGRKE